MQQYPCVDTTVMTEATTLLSVNKIQLSLLLLMTADMQQNATTFDNCCILLHLINPILTNVADDVHIHAGVAYMRSLYAYMRS